MKRCIPLLMACLWYAISYGQADGHPDAEGIPLYAERDAASDWERTARENGIKSEVMEGVPHVRSGYYLVVDEFKRAGKLKRSLRKWHKKGFRPGYFQIGQEGENYVYLDRYNSGEEAIKAYNSALPGTFSRDIWLMVVNQGQVATVDDFLIDSNIRVKNLAINSRFSDFAPMYFGDDHIVFSSHRDSSKTSRRLYRRYREHFLDLYVGSTEGQEALELDRARYFSEVINTKYHEAAASFTSDRSALYFTRSHSEKRARKVKEGVNELKIYTSKKAGQNWTKGKELPFNSKAYSVGHPALSPDGKKLFFVSDMPGSMGGTDLYMVEVLGEDLYSEPQNLGPMINTTGKEMFPFVTEKNLYFSSDGREGLGKLDVYRAEFLTEGGFKEVVNLGAPINSAMDDFSYIINEVDGTGYFASNRSGGKGEDDLYSFEMAKVRKRSAITGIATDPITKELITDARISLLDSNNNVLKEVTVDDKGHFIFEDLDPETQYTLKVDQAEFLKSSVMALTSKEGVVMVDVPLKQFNDAVVVEDGVRKLKMDVIYFDFDKSNINPEAAMELDILVSIMEDYQDMTIKIESHTDSRGNADYNHYLSEKRAKSTRDYIVSQGIAQERIISAKGYGEQNLLNKCKDGVVCDRLTHERNRRSEFIIVRM